MKGLGIDLCGIQRIQRVLEGGDGFLRRYFTQEEQAYIARRGKAGAESAAAMFAAKEAFLKALGTGIGGGIPLTEVSVAHEESGQPRYVLGETAQQAMAQRGAGSAWLSLSHEAGVAAAVCVLE